MDDPEDVSYSATERLLREEIVRLNRIIRSLMDRAERVGGSQRTAFGLFEATVVLEQEVRRRTEQLEQALRDNAKITGALQHTKVQMEREIQQRIEAQASLEIANRKLEALTVTEPLTGLANRRGFTEALNLAWQQAVLGQKPLGVAMIDIDNFKLYNDRYGHVAGDDCLRRVAETIHKSVRQADMVARYGGEEIALILPSADESMTMQVAERARVSVEALRIPSEDVSRKIVTISAGVATTRPTEGSDPMALLVLADRALYQAKAGGRNRVCMASQDIAVE